MEQFLVLGWCPLLQGHPQFWSQQIIKVNCHLDLQSCPCSISRQTSEWQPCQIWWSRYIMSSPETNTSVKLQQEPNNHSTYAHIEARQPSRSQYKTSTCCSNWVHWQNQQSSCHWQGFLLGVRERSDTMISLLCSCNNTKVVLVPPNVTCHLGTMC